MKRYHEQLDRTKRVHMKHLRKVHNYPKVEVTCICDLQAGRFYKQSWHGYHRPKCFMCHGDKLLNVKSIKDRIRDDIFKDSLEDYNKYLCEVS